VSVESQHPLFPGYVFCRFDANKRLPILTTSGVISVLGFGNEPAPIPDEEIEAVSAALCSGLPAVPCAYLREGQRVRVTLLTEHILFLPAEPGRVCMNPEQAERRELWHFRRGAFIGVRIVVIFQGDAARCAAISDLGVIPFCLGTKGELDAGLSDTKTTRKSMV